MKSYSGKKLTLNGRSKLFSVALMAGVLAMSPLSAELSTGKNGISLQQNSAQAAGLADISLLEDQGLRADYNSTTGVLTLDIDGEVLLNVGALNEQYYNFQLPEAFQEILALPNFQDAAQIEYEQRLLLGLIPVNSGTISGDDLDVDPSTGLITGTSFEALNLSVASTLSAELVIDLNALGEDLPVSDSGELEFFGAATSSPLVDVFVLTDEGAQASLYNLENTDLSVGTVTDQDTVVEGIKKRGSATEIRVFDGDEEIGSGTVDSDANSPYSVDIPQQQAGTVLTVQAYTSSRDPVGEALEVTVSDVTAPETPDVDGVTDRDTSVTGTGEPGTEVTVTKEDEVIGSGTVDGSGNFEVDIAEQPGGTELGVFLTDDAGLTSEAVVITVEDTTAPNAPDVDGVEEGATEVTGSGEPGAEVIVTTPDGSYTGVVDEDGNFAVEIPEQEAGTDITVVLEDEDGNTSDETVVTVEDVTAPDAPVLDQVTSKSTSVSGTAEAGSTVVIWAGSEELARGEAGSDGSFTLPIDAQDGDTVLTAIAIDDAGNESDEATTTVVKVEAEVTDRISGINRYLTAIAISQKGWDSADTVVLATSRNFPDALAGGPIAYQEDAPMLLTINNKLGTETREEIERLGAKKVIILGGTGAISANVEAELRGMDLAIDRIGGKTRYETATLISEELQSDEAVVVSGLNFPDVLSASPYAAKNGVPILLTRADRLPAETEQALEDVTSTQVIGGIGAVNEDVFDELPDPTRYGGKNRYETGNEIATRLMIETDKAYIATGLDFPDALTGSVLAAKNDSPILLVLPDRIPEATNELLPNYDDFTIFGGTGAVSDKVKGLLDKELED
ncbi:Ig-like domain-containing protein [Planococcus alpniumensis]|uniref:Ig-like domain-containing protein n=1 Tax=Planococcus alpniumensis TaxID=2708345 RepID=UPI001B8B0AEE|nr:Ig-like domain-containing protein [Planococcus sp. MSAK28401]